MSEMPNGEKIPTSENSENEKHIAFQSAIEREQKIMEEINDVFAITQDRAEAEKIVLETLAPKMDAVIEESKQALHIWLEAIKK